MFGIMLEIIKMVNWFSLIVSSPGFVISQDDSDWRFTSTWDKSVFALKKNYSLLIKKWNKSMLWDFKRGKEKGGSVGVT